MSAVEARRKEMNVKCRIFVTLVALRKRHTVPIWYMHVRAMRTFLIWTGETLGVERRISA